MEYFMINESDIKYNFKEALKEFNFKKVKKVMKSLKWSWKYSPKSPPIKEMKSCLKWLFEDAMRSPNIGLHEVVVSTGGFELTVDKDESVCIRFIVAESYGGVCYNES
jgi:hypothetical protein